MTHIEYNQLALKLWLEHMTPDRTVPSLRYFTEGYRRCLVGFLRERKEFNTSKVFGSSEVMTKLGNYYMAAPTRENLNAEQTYHEVIARIQRNIRALERNGGEPLKCNIEAVETALGGPLV